MKTYSPKPADVKRNWYVVDASEITLGRLATRVAELLMGKGKPSFAKHIDMGDYVVVVNSDQLLVTGKKLQDKPYRHYSGYPGGLKTLSLEEKIAKDSRTVIEKAVYGMIPANKLRKERLARLKVYKDNEHAHTAQKPTAISLKASDK